MLTTFEELGWLHDGTLLQLAYLAPEWAPRSIELTIECPPDLGYPPWDGKRIVLAAVDVAVSEHLAFSIVNPESIDRIRPGVSAPFRARLDGAIKIGMRIPDLAFTISFHSGSTLQVMCEQLVVRAPGHREPERD